MIRSVEIFDGHYPVRTAFTDRLPENAAVLDSLGDDEKIRFKTDLLRKHVGVPVSSVVMGRQTHSGNILAVKAEDPEGRLAYVDETFTTKAPGGWDGLVTDWPGVMLAVKTGDCVPVFLYDPAAHAIGMVHSGWRGTCSKISAHAVGVMTELFGTDPAHVLAALGPSVCGQCYEVGEELIEAFELNFTPEEARGFFTPKSPAVEAAPRKYLLDVSAGVRLALEQAGVKPANITDLGICTYERKDYPSYRRDKVRPVDQIFSGIVLM